jgi:hypothetical protein
MIACIESCIGGGKGFFLKYLSTYARWAWPEVANVLVLMDDSAANMTEFSSDRPRWAMFAQLSAMLQHAIAQRSTDDADDDRLVLVEGSLFTDFRCSAKRWRAMGLLTPGEFRVLEDWYEIASVGARRDAVVYLDNDVHAHFERVVANSKREQAWVSVGNLADMKRDYDAMLSLESTNGPLATPNGPLATLFIPCAPNFEDNEPELLAMAETTIDFLKKVHLRRARQRLDT